MESEKDYSFFSKKGARKLSPFLAQRLYCDLVTEALDEQRRLALEDFIETHPEEAKVIAGVESGLEVCRRLAKVEVGSEVLIEIVDQSLGLEQKLGKAGWYQWPAPLRWSVEAALLALMVLAVSLFTPWDQLWKKLSTTNPYFVLSETNRIMGLEADTLDPELSAAHSSDQPGGDSEVTKQEEFIQLEAVAPTDPEEARALASDPRSLEKVNSEFKAEPLTPGHKGVVYRAFMRTEDLEVVTAKMKQLLVSFGGKKAGDIELGWKRPGGSYFHFTLAESHFEEVVAAMREMGEVVIREEPHEDIMAEGLARIIVWVEEVETHW